MTTTAPKAPFSSMTNPFLPLPEVFARNPFASADPTEVPENAPEGSYTYALVQSAPSVPAEECEVNAEAVEVAIRWGATTLHVSHLTPPRSFFVGEAAGKHAAVDFELPADKLGMARFPLVRKAQDGSARVVIPAGAKGTATINGQVEKIGDLAKTADASTEIAGAIELPLRASTKVRFELGGFEMEIASVKAGRKVSGRFSFDRGGLPFQAISMALHLGMLGAAAMFMPPSALASEDALSHEQVEGLKMILNANAERELDAAKQEDPSKDTKGDREGGTGQAASGESGKMGSMTSRATNGKWGAEGPKDNPDVHLSRESAIAMARDFGMVGLLNAGLGGDKNAPTVPWGGFDTLGRDPKSALGGMWGSDIGENAGAGGLGLSGVGEGAGGNGLGIGLGKVGTYGHGDGLGDGDGFGRGHGTGFGRGHKQADLTMRQGKTESSGHIPPEVIQRIVRQNFGRFRLCYENGLRGNPNLAGRVAVRFVIGRDGGVMSASNGGSDLPDASVVSCVVGGFRGLSFPTSDEGGIVTVTYPISFAPAGK